MTTSTCLGGWELPINLMDGDSILGGDILKLLNELTVSEVGHLATPSVGREHWYERKVFKEDGVVLAAQLMSELPLEVTASVYHHLVKPVEFQTLPLTVMRAWHTFREVPRLTLQLAQSALQELRIVNSRAVANRQVLAQAEVDTDGCTIT